MKENIKIFNYDAQSNKRLKYDAWLHWVMHYRCNMNCEYCFSFDSNEKKYDKILKIDIPSMIRTLDKTNKTFRISFVGGEPFLTPNIVEACSEITKKHYISFITNLTSIKFKEFSENIDPKKVIHIHASLHIKELEKNKLLDRYIENFLLLKKKGFSIDAVEVAHPSLSGKINMYRTFFKKRRIDLKFGPFSGIYDGKKYPESYTKKEIDAFGMKEVMNVFNQKGKLCNAGYNVGTINHEGNIKPCRFIDMDLGNIYADIRFRDRLIRCPFEFCNCPMKCFDKKLFNRALKENKSSELNRLFYRSNI